MNTNVAKPNIEAIQTLANALEVKDILTQASKLANELALIANSSQVTSRHFLTDKPTGIKMTRASATRTEFLLTQLKELSELYTERMRQPADHPHRDQPKRYLGDAKKMLDSDPKAAAAEVAKFMKYRAKFVKDGSKPVDFREFMIGTVAVIVAAIKNSKAQTADTNQVDVVNQARRRSEQTIDAAARSVENDANSSGIIGQNLSNSLNMAIVSGGHIGANAGSLAKVALRDADDGERLRGNRTPFDSLRTMKPGME